MKFVLQTSSPPQWLSSPQFLACRRDSEGQMRGDKVVFCFRKRPKKIITRKISTWIAGNAIFPSSKWAWSTLTQMLYSCQVVLSYLLAQFLWSLFSLFSSTMACLLCMSSSILWPISASLFNPAIGRIQWHKERQTLKKMCFV